MLLLCRVCIAFNLSENTQKGGLKWIALLKLSLNSGPFIVSFVSVSMAGMLTSFH